LGIVVLLSELCLNIALQHFISTASRTLRRCGIYQASIPCSIRSGVQRFSTEETSFTDEDLARWERMYEMGTPSDSDLESATLLSPKSEVRIISFDLDNTLWNTYGCINAANDALAAFLDQHQIKQPKRVEHIMQDLFRSNKRRYSPILGEEAAHATLLTLLRTDAISVLLEEYNGFSQSKAQYFAKQAFEIWANARHDAIPQNLATNVLSCLDKISRLKTSQGHRILIGAITDGNSDPRRVEILQRYFDFCVNAEAVGVSKPDKRVYMEAIRQVASHPAAAGLIDVESSVDIEAGPFWVHVGDDFVKDIVAAKDLKMRTVWATELVQKSTIDTKSSKKTGDDSDVKDFVKRISDERIVEMAIGADNYLVDSFTREFVDAVTEEFHQLSEIITKWHADAMGNQATGWETSASNERVPLLTPTSDTEPDESDVQALTIRNGQLSRLDSSPSTMIQPRAFQIIRENCSSIVAAPLRDRDARTMKEVMGIAQMDKASGVFAFSPEDVENVRVGKKVLMVRVGDTALEFSREIFSNMSVQDVLSLAEDNPLKLSLYVKDAVSAPSFDLF